MKLKTLFTTVFVAFQVILHAQTPNNEINTNGKKHGDWLVYMDKNWKEISDSSKATYVRVTTYDNGMDLYPMGPCGKANWKLIVTETAQIKRNPKMLDGVYKWYDASGKLMSEHVFANNRYISCKEYYPTGELRHHFDYGNLFQNEDNTYLVTVYSKTGKKKIYVMRNGELGWSLYLMDNEPTTGI